MQAVTSYSPNLDRLERELKSMQPTMQQTMLLRAGFTDVARLLNMILTELQNSNRIAVRIARNGQQQPEQDDE